MRPKKSGTSKAVRKKPASKARLARPALSRDKRELVIITGISGAGKAVGAEDV